MRIYGLIGKSGSGKSHRAQSLAKELGVEYIIDDGLLIKGNSILAGMSAKREETKLAAIRRAVFFDGSHREGVRRAITEAEPESMLILGTSDHMVDRIVENLNLPPIYRRIYIEDISSQREIETAEKVRREQGKHVIPVPTFAVKKDFSGYFIDSLKSIAKRGKQPGGEEPERTVVRPTYSYLGKYFISDSALRAMIVHAGESTPGVGGILKVHTDTSESGIRIDIDIAAVYGYYIPAASRKTAQSVKGGIEYMTGLNILQINIYVRTLTFKE